MNGLKRAALGLFALLSASLAVDAATMHDNYVYFWLNGVQSFSFTPTGYSITSGQPYGGTTSGINKPGQQGYILVKAGRKKSKPVAQWFQQQVGSGATMACNSTGSFPDEANFAVQGNLTFSTGGKTYTCDNVVVGQGSYLKHCKRMECMAELTPERLWPILHGVLTTWQNNSQCA